MSDDYGSDSSDPITITVVEPSGAGFTFDSNTEGLRYNSFQDTSLGTPTAIAWDFSFTGDTGNPGATFNVEATSAAGATVSHDFSQTGIAMVALRASYASLPDDYVIQAVDVDAILFSEVIGTLQNRCNSCHGAVAPADGLSFAGDELTAYNALYDVNVALGAACSGIAGSERVDPFDATNSFLYSISAATSATCEGMSNVPQGADLTRIRDWINQGAAFD